MVPRWFPLWESSREVLPARFLPDKFLMRALEAPTPSCPSSDTKESVLPEMVAKRGERMSATNVLAEPQQRESTELLNLLIVDDDRSTRELCKQAAQQVHFHTFV